MVSRLFLDSIHTMQGGRIDAVRVVHFVAADATYDQHIESAEGAREPLNHFYANDATRRYREELKRLCPNFSRLAKYIVW